MTINNQSDQAHEWEAEVAKRIACVVISYQVGLSCETMWKEYADQTKADIGTFWLSMAKQLDLDSVAIAGHSLEGITASEACKADTRFKPCLNFDGLEKGGPFSADETAIPPEQPFMFMTKESQLHPKLTERFESTSESYWIVVRGALHGRSDNSANCLMRAAMSQLNLSAWTYHRILKLARTIADLAGCEEIHSVHLAEALQYRPKLMMG